jgi:hypothetical protein
MTSLIHPLGLVDGDGTGRAAANSLRDPEDWGSVAQSKEALYPLLWPWKGGFEDMLGDLEWVMALFWARSCA